MAFREPEARRDGEGRMPSVNVLDEPLRPCGTDPVTGFWRDGCCNTGSQDAGMHTVCAVMTDAFLAFSQRVGNDLSTPVPAYGFAGLKPGDRWCLCAARWVEALEAGAAPPIVLQATHQATLRLVSLDDLKSHAIDLN